MKIVALDSLGWDVFEGGVKKLGGAGSNFIYHMHHMGADATIISAVGNDDAGIELKDTLKQNNIPAYLQMNDQPTSLARANVDADGIPQWQLYENVAWDNIIYDAAVRNLTQKADVFYFGSLPQRHEVTKQTIRQIVQNKKIGAKTFVDINIRQDYYSPEVLDFCINHADYLKISDEEMPIIAQTLSLPESPDDFYNSIKDRVEMFIYTRGEGGAQMYRGNEISAHAGFKIVPKDTVGAGDSFSAAVCALALTGNELSTINHFANAVASYICTQEGAMHPVPFKIF